MRLDQSRTYKLNVEEDGAGSGNSFLKRDTDLTITDQELLHAVVTSVIPAQRQMLDYPGMEAAELGRRLAMMEYSLEADGEYLQKSDRILELDESERSLVSYYIGICVTKLVSRKLHGDEFLVPLKLIRLQQGQKVEKYDGKRRADQISHHRGKNSWSVWEVRGRSNNSAQALEGGAAAAKQIGKVGADVPAFSGVCMTYYGSKCLSVRMQGVTPEPEGIRLSFSQADYYRAYYYCVYHLILACYEKESVRNRIVLGEDRIEAKVTVGSQKARRVLVIGMPRKLFLALSQKEDAPILEAVDREDGDGITVWFESES